MRTLALVAALSLVGCAGVAKLFAPVEIARGLSGFTWGETALGGAMLVQNGYLLVNGRRKKKRAAELVALADDALSRVNKSNDELSA